MLVLVLALFWVAILIPVVVRYFRDSGTERSIESFYAEREMLSRQERAAPSEDYYQRPSVAPVAERDLPGRPRLTVVHPGDTLGTLQARGSWDDWSRDNDYEEGRSAGQSMREKNRYAAAYSSVPGDGFGSGYNAPYDELSTMRVRRRRIFVSLLVMCLLVTALTFLSSSPTLVDAAVVAWAALLGFVVLALVSLGLGYMGAPALDGDRTSTSRFSPMKPLYPDDFASFDEDEDDSNEERQWQRETVPRRAFG
jgi:hypothetical protein